MILQHILCQFTKFVLGALKYSQDMTRCHSNNDICLFPLRMCIMILAPVSIFTGSFQCLYLHSSKRLALPQYGL